MKIAIVTIITLLISSSAVSAQEAELVLPEAGVLAGYGGLPTGGNDQIVDVPWAGEDLDSANTQPIIGSILKTSDTSYSYTVTNTTEDSYTARFKIDQLDKTGRKIKSNTRNANLAAGAVSRGEVRSSPQASNVTLILTKWDRKAKESPDSEILEKIAAKKSEIAELEKSLSTPSVKPSTTVVSNQPAEEKGTNFADENGKDNFVGNKKRTPDFLKPKEF